MSANVAFEILYKEYYVRVFGLCRRLLNSASLAEDATQEAFMRAYRNFNKYDSGQPFWQWIAAIASNHCVDLLRRQSRMSNLFGDEDTEIELLESDGEETLSKVIESEDSEALNSAIGNLPDKYRVPLVLAYFHDASYESIAENLSINRNHVGVLLLRAKQQLRGLLNELVNQS
ncbi:MAG: sigma-70 family RNA polymerase sigma factor [Gammaproteobacteria bacterium]|jgi:RNA polymerase sigma-70 factor, ECF subfamily|nr:sigma-70 family RNA polymerase sigma factor [Gammaproteobacteria bacterium]MBT4494201.1 sigma-70 family RNA polymerase sigma factor [Gammaproteobacteria bacterium]MBT7369701.1 sigma-70 family RNA polymerase sigma factor [Gammaproteobacteria bacterium]